MSSKKDKLLESAQKFIAKGQLDRAIKDYEQIVALDSGDIRYRQRLAELLVRANRKEEAIGEYEAIGRNYSDNAFYLKAIAVYKQIQKLDPGNVKVTLSLASLNEKQGLIGNALAEYNTALSYYQKTRQLPEAVKVLEQMLAAEPGNLNTLLKFAETYYSAGVHEKSYEHFTKLAMHLGKSGDESAFTQICNRVASLFPDRKDFQLELMSALAGDGDVGAAIHHLLAMTKNDNGNRRAWELLAEAYQRQGNHEQCTATLQRMVSLFPEESSFREKLSKDTHDAGPGKTTETEIVSPDGALPEEPSPEPSPAAGEESIVPETDDSGDEALWEEEIDLDLADEQGEPEPSLNAHESPVSLDAETTGEAPAQAESAMPGREESILETPSLPDDFSEIDLEIDTEVTADRGTVTAQGAYTGEQPLMDGFAEIDLEVDENAAADSGGLGALSANVGELPLYVDFSEIDLEIDTEDTTDSVVPELQDADAGELPFLSDDVSEIDLEIDEEEAADGDVPELQDVHINESPLLDEDSELDLAVDGEETHLSLDDPLVDAGEEEHYSSGMPASEAEQATEMPEVGEDAGELFDLGAELRQEEPEDSDSTESSKYSLEGLFSAFKQGIDQQFDQGDTETHYNLGIAYKEMGLYDDAIAEFQAASLAADRAVDCLTLQGVCHRDKGDADSAEEAFRRGLALEGLSNGEALSLKYELALLLESTGRTEEALQLYCEVRTVDAGFREVSSKIATMAGEAEVQVAEELELLELDVEETE